MDLLQYTSLCFILIVYKAFMNNHIFMSVLWSLLTITSFFYHGNRNNKIYYWIDQILIYLIFFIGILYVLKSNKTISMIGIISFISVIVIYIFELRLNNDMDLERNEQYPDKPTQLHMIIHFITTITFFVIFHFTDNTVNIKNTFISKNPNKKIGW